MERFENQVAIITGAGRGIGEAIATRLAAEGAKIAVVSRTEANSQKAAEDLNASRPDTAKAYAVDVADFDAVQAAGEQIFRELLDGMKNEVEQRREDVDASLSSQLNVTSAVVCFT